MHDPTRSTLRRPLVTILALLGSAAGAATLRATPLRADGGAAVELARLTGSDSAPGDLFGAAVAADGDTLLVGAEGDDHAAGANAGAAYVFVRSGTSFVQQAWLTAPDGASDDLLGRSVALSGDTALLGADEDDDGGIDSGSAHVFVRAGTTWVHEAKLTASDPGAEDAFGYAVSIDGDNALVGAWGVDDGGVTDGGAAYMYVRTGTTWTQQVRFFAVDAADYDRFGRAVAFQGDTAVVGAAGDDHVGGGSNAGSVWVFRRTGSLWTIEAKVVPNDSTPGDAFGASVAVQGDTMVVGAPLDFHSGAPFGGSAYVFERTGTTWAQVAKLLASDPGSSDQFGGRVALQDDTVLVGAAFDENAGGRNAGSAYLFTSDGTTWTQTEKLVASDAAYDDSFGAAVALGGGVAAVGAPIDDAATGSVYAYALPPKAASFCDASDAAPAACPCGNPGAPDSGCDIAQGTGGVRADAILQDTVGLRATITAVGFPPMGVPTALVIRAETREPAPVPFGDGLRCVGLTGFARLAGTAAAGGSSAHSFGHGAGPGAYHYQVWFRNQPVSYCVITGPSAGSFNLSNGLTLTW